MGFAVIRSVLMKCFCNRFSLRLGRKFNLKFHTVTGKKSVSLSFRFRLQLYISKPVNLSPEVNKRFD